MKMLQKISCVLLLSVFSNVYAEYCTKGNPCIVDIEKEEREIATLIKHQLSFTMYHLEKFAFGEYLEKASKFINGSEEPKNSEEQNDLGNFHYSWNGLVHDFKKSAKHFTESAQQGDVDSQLNLAIMYVKGLGVPQNYQESLEWFMKAEKQGNADAQNYLGYIYDEGIGVDSSCKESMYFYGKASENDHAMAQNNLANMYIIGECVDIDFKKAHELYEKASENGSAAAQLSLATMSKNGMGIPKDDHEKAVKWDKKSLAQGDERAKLFLDHFYAGWKEENN